MDTEKCFERTKAPEFLFTPGASRLRIHQGKFSRSKFNGDEMTSKPMFTQNLMQMSLGIYNIWAMGTSQNLRCNKL